MVFGFSLEKPKALQLYKDNWDGYAAIYLVRLRAQGLFAIVVLIAKADMKPDHRADEREQGGYEPVYHDMHNCTK